MEVAMTQPPFRSDYLSTADDDMEISSDAGRATASDIDLDLDDDFNELKDVEDEKMDDGGLEEQQRGMHEDYDMDGKKDEDMLEDVIEMNDGDMQEDLTLEDEEIQDTRIDDPDLEIYDPVHDPIPDINSATMTPVASAPAITHSPVAQDIQDTGDNIAAAIGPSLNAIEQPQSVSAEGPNPQPIVNEKQGPAAYERIDDNGSTSLRPDPTEQGTLQKTQAPDNAHEGDQEDFDEEEDTDNQVSQPAPKDISSTHEPEPESESEAEAEAETVVESTNIAGIAAPEDVSNGDEHQNQSSLSDEHAVYVIYDNSEYSLFPPRQGEDGQTYLLHDPALMHVSLHELFAAIRELLATSIEKHDELQLEIGVLGLLLSEKTTNTTSASLGEVVEIYMSLCYNDGEEPDPLFLNLTIRDHFQYRLDHLRDMATEGKGLSEACDLGAEEAFLAKDDEGAASKDHDVSHLDNQERKTQEASEVAATGPSKIKKAVPDADLGPAVERPDDTVSDTAVQEEHTEPIARAAPLPQTSDFGIENERQDHGDVIDIPEDEEFEATHHDGPNDKSRTAGDSRVAKAVADADDLAKQSSQVQQSANDHEGFLEVEVDPQTDEAQTKEHTVQNSKHKGDAEDSKPTHEPEETGDDEANVVSLEDKSTKDDADNKKPEIETVVGKAAELDQPVVEAVPAKNTDDDNDDEWQLRDSDDEEDGSPGQQSGNTGQPKSQQGTSSLNEADAFDEDELYDFNDIEGVNEKSSKPSGEATDSSSSASNAISRKRSWDEDDVADNAGDSGSEAKKPRAS